jgi:16S rRNA (cytosine1402-N4)-methyltransferase
LLDLGVSSLQFDKAEKGFSFMQDGPLRMTMGDNTPVDAYRVVNEWEEESLESILRGYGEERFARKIAHAIVVARDIAPIKTTHELRDLVIGCYPSFMRKGRINPATKTFQAIRIAVNDELGVLNRILVEAPRFLIENGVIAIISFHSLEDRIVKHAFRSLADQGLGEILTKRPIVATEEEIMANPRARSAKLRIFISHAN